ncbi:MAG: DUF4230 domain-containing protein [candidate division SR1 bacterium]|nr:DUF4230 domain-containing protein [candidate division SR1 bacterium]
MKRLIKYLVALLIVLVCVYSFWLWLQYKGATVIKHTTASIMTELAKVDKLETVTKTFTKTLEGEQQLASLIPGIGVNQIIGSALFKDKMVLDVKGIVRAGYMVNDVVTGAIKVSNDGTITIILGEPEVFGVTLTGTTKSTTLGDIATPEDIAMETQLRTKAGEMMIQEALSGNILQDAKDNAQTTLQNLFLKAGIQIKEVIIKGTGDIQ